jgi:hypothetical protein
MRQCAQLMNITDPHPQAAWDGRIDRWSEARELQSARSGGNAITQGCTFEIMLVNDNQSCANALEGFLMLSELGCSTQVHTSGGSSSSMEGGTTPVGNVTDWQSSRVRIRLHGAALQGTALSMI